MKLLQVILWPIGHPILLLAPGAEDQDGKAAHGVRGGRGGPFQGSDDSVRENLPEVGRNWHAPSPP